MRVRMVVKLCTHWRMKSSGRNSCSRIVPGILIPPAEKLHATAYLNRQSSQN